MATPVTLVTVSQEPILAFFANDGTPLVGGMLTTSVGGLPYPTYSDANGQFPLPNPIVLNNRGEIATAAGTSTPLYVVPNTAYTYTLQDSLGNTIWVAPNVQTPLTALTSALILPLLTSQNLGAILYAQTQAEKDAQVTPTDYSVPTGRASRYGVDVTGATDSTAAMQKWINASWIGETYAAPWNGTNGANMVPVLPPARVRVTGSTIIPCNVTVQGTAPPGGYTESHTRIIMDSTGITPARSWSPNTPFIVFNQCQPLITNGYYYVVTVAGTSGAFAPAWPTTAAQTVIDGSVTWSCVGACTATDNRNKPMFKFSRAVSPTTYPNGGVLADAFLNTTISNLEFWYVTPGSTFNAPLSGSSNGTGDYPNGGTILFDVDTVDTRILNCVFQNSPCAIRILNVTSSSSQGDGFPGQGNCGLFIDGCEFDAGGGHVWASNSVLDITFRNCEFFGGIHLYQNCSGKVSYENCRFFGGAYIDASNAGNNFTLFRVNGGETEQAGNFDTFSVYGAQQVDIKNIMFAGATGLSTIVLNQCKSGSASGNSINDSGYNASPNPGGLTASAAIKLIDCINLMVAANNISATNAASYNGFGILTLANVTGSGGNFISNNAITAPYTGAFYNGQFRYINIATNYDIIGPNYIQPIYLATKYGAIAPTSTTLTYGVTNVINALAGNEFIIPVTNNANFNISAPQNATTGQDIDIVIQNNTGGALGTALWDPIFKMDGWTQPVAGASATIKFRFNGTNWVQRFKGTNTVPN